jgi:hypothetical protein
MSITSCVLEDCTLENCTVENSIVTGSSLAFTDGCLFKDSIISGITSSAIILREAKVENCFTRRAYHKSRSLSGEAPLDPAAAQFATYEDFRNVLLTERAVEWLRRWIWRMKRLRRGEPYRGVGHLFRAKAAGKRPFYVSERYPVEEQLELPLRRMRMWSLGTPNVMEMESDSNDYQKN